jgi:hypothetical protein
MFGVSVSFYQHYLEKTIRLLVSLLHGSDKFVLLVHPRCLVGIRSRKSKNDRQKYGQKKKVKQ